MAASKSGAGKFLAGIRRFAAPTWQVKLEQFSSTRLDALDAVIYKGQSFNRTGRVTFMPKFKNKANIRYLCQSSYHSPAVHHAWPLAYASRLKTLSSSTVQFAEAISTFQKRLATDFINVEFNKRSILPSRPVRIRVGRHKTLWIFLAFHRCLYDVGLGTKLSDLARRWQQHLCEAFSAHVTVRIAWARPCCNISSFLRREFMI